MSAEPNEVAAPEHSIEFLSTAKQVIDWTHIATGWARVHWLLRGDQAIKNENNGPTFEECERTIRAVSKHVRDLLRLEQQHLPKNTPSG